MDRCHCDQGVGECCPVCNESGYPHLHGPGLDESEKIEHLPIVEPKFIQVLTHKADEWQDKLVALDAAGGVWQYMGGVGWARLSMKRLA